MPAKTFLPALFVTAVAALAIGGGASHLWDNRAIGKLKADRDLAWNCRYSGKSVPPCPVLYRNTRIEWRDRIQTVVAPDKKQAARIASLSIELASAERMIHALEHPRRWLRTAAGPGWQNGTTMHPYTTDDHCPPGSVVVYDTGLSGGSLATRHSGDPGVCYVRATLQNRVAFSPQPR